MKTSFCAFRLDDIAPAMDWPRFNLVRDIFDMYNVKPLIGVVPENRDPELDVGAENPDFWEMIRQLQAGGWTIAQHGYQHRYVNDNSGLLKVNPRSEFAGLDYREQEGKIKTGKRILEANGVYTDIFMAPGHSFDQNTLRALKNSGFRYVTDGYTRHPYEYYGLKFIPCFDGYPKKRRGLVVVCIHTNTSKEKVIQRCEEFIKNNRDTVIDFCEALELPNKNSCWRVFQAYFRTYSRWADRWKRFVKYCLKQFGITIGSQ